MDNVIFSVAIAFLATYFAIPVIIRIARDKHLFDEPDERKVHINVTPTLGGLGIFAGFSLGVLMGVQFLINYEFQYFMAAFMLMFFIGMKDDILIISATKKFIAQLIATGIIIKFGGIQLHNMYGFLGINEIPATASFLLTAFTVLVITNAFNLIDGIDGLAGGISMVALIIFGGLFFNSGYLSYAVMAFALAAAVFAFLIYNFSPAKIFMGDTGSLIIGMAASILVIKLINVIGLGLTVIPAHAAPAIGFAILLVPLFDTLRVFTMRIFSRRSPFSPDRNHLHHYLLDAGMNHAQIALSLSAGTLGFFFMAYFMRNLNCTINIAVLLVTASLLTAVVVYYRNKKLAQKAVIKEVKQESLITTKTTIINLAPDKSLVMETE